VRLLSFRTKSAPRRRIEQYVAGCPRARAAKNRYAEVVGNLRYRGVRVDPYSVPGVTQSATTPRKQRNLIIPLRVGRTVMFLYFGRHPALTAVDRIARRAVQRAR
jgi:hypothetical protein